jgi:hypothetical protein
MVATVAVLKKHLGTTLHGGERPRGMRLNFKKGQDLSHLSLTDGPNHQHFKFQHGPEKQVFKGRIPVKNMVTENSL